MHDHEDDGHISRSAGRHYSQGIVVFQQLRACRQEVVSANLCWMNLCWMSIEMQLQVMLQAKPAESEFLEVQLPNLNIGG